MVTDCFLSDENGNPITTHLLSCNELISSRGRTSRMVILPSGEQASLENVKI